MSTRRVVLVALVAAGTVLAGAAVRASGSWRDLWLNLLAEAVGAAFIVLVVDVLFERSRMRNDDARRRSALVELGSILGELDDWIRSMLVAAGSTGAVAQGSADPLSTNLDEFASHLGTIDFAAAGSLARDRSFAEWARRTFSQTGAELGRWELSFVDSAGLFGDEFRHGAESLRRFVRAMGSFLEGVDTFVARERPAGPVRAFDGITELTAEDAARLIAELRAFLRFYSTLCSRYDVPVRT